MRKHSFNCFRMGESMIIVIGGGAAGMMAAIMLTKAGRQVTLIEKNKSLGKKLAATGNGRCNYTNAKMSSEYYYGQDRDSIACVLEQFGYHDTIRLFEELGILSRSKDGYIYPYSNQASTVVERLRDCCYEQGVKVCLETTVLHLSRDDRFHVITDHGHFYGEQVILACGGLASQELGGSALGYDLAKKCGHQVSPLWPGLTGYISDENWLKAFSGVRIQGSISILVNGRVIAREAGEIQCTKQGISGIPAFQLCRQVAQALAAGERVSGMIDYVPVLSEEELSQYIEQRRERFTMEQIVSGLVNGKCVSEIIKRGTTVSQIVDSLKHFPFSIKDTAGFDKAQVTAGGVPLTEISSETMQSKLMPGLYITGELLDADGICGGYNLHWAWATAVIAARDIVNDRRNK